MPSKKTTIAVIAGAAVVVGAAVSFVARRNRVSGVEDDDAFNTPIVMAKNPNTSVSKTEAVVPEVKPEVLASIAVKASDVSSVENKLLAEALNEMGMENISPKATTSTNVTTVKDFDNNRKEFPLLGLSVAVPTGWEIREDPSPFPNLAMLTLWNQELASDDAQQQQQPGLEPMIVVSVEDVRGDNVDLGEFKDRCKELAINQMIMMTGGALQPKVTKDNSIKEGPFRHVLEYTQSLPPVYDMVVLQMLEVRNSIAYTFQIMCSRSVMPKYESIFMKMARDIRIAEKISTALGHVELYTGTVKVNVDTTWSWDYPGKNGALATFTTSSPVKKEEINLYTQDKVPTTPHKPRDEKMIEDVVIISAFDGAQQQKTFTYNGYSLIVKPLQKAISYLAEEELVTVIKSITPSTETPKPKKGGIFVNEEFGYRVEVVGGGRIVASRIAGGFVAYAPRGTSDGGWGGEGEQPPTVTIRVGSPEDDPDCMGSIEEWEARMQQEAAEGDIKEITRTTVNKKPCLTFTSQTMEGIGPGQQMEVRAKVFIFVREGKTMLVRWEMAVGLWRKFEREMNVFMDSFEYI